MTDTKLMKESTDQDQIDTFIDNLSIKGRNPEEIANVILFLCEMNLPLLQDKLLVLMAA